jgi:hypothetical protein
MVLELIELLVGFLAPLARENLQVFQGRRVDGGKAVPAIDPPRGLDQPLARDHGLGQIVAEALERPRLDTLVGRHVVRIPVS